MCADEPGRAAGAARRRGPDARRWLSEVGPSLGVAGFIVGSITVERTTLQTVNTSAGALPSLSLRDRLAVYRGSAAKQTVLMFAQYGLTRELKLGMDALSVPPAVSTMVACGVFGVPCSSLSYNWAIQDTYRHFKQPAPPSSGVVGYVRQKVCPGVLWSFLRAGIATGGGLYLGAEVSPWIDRQFRSRDLDVSPLVSKVVSSLAAGSVCSLATQCVHNVALIAGRMAVQGETRQAPMYTTVALTTAWREMRWSIFT
eukprot:SRR837773.4630.p1 GENE.SRR837773.4630~~SRR837773.4630.p1  ORF type:complete len:272 (+),score=33.31 SRR837773.4630:51-818(+)